MSASNTSRKHSCFFVLKHSHSLDRKYIEDELLRWFFVKIRRIVFRKPTAVGILKGSFSASIKNEVLRTSRFFLMR